ncbi:excalibur calcium-binding domain-containing protein [Sphingomonas sp. BN140010]|uniref:Excalibur calcium-binding domain-containing protein n=1 Tax=Sphingomonas arvum TaxID=2992113 RepID=A0ABT3JEB0_9SPHN|nr:excalibur calcium-binding domain-containing protein [Sphingomonas sp. BN140010]MCW3797405.1 excalibur calcium-binding domain-containing protein [Sphingomonas sp. BN140010]
MRQSSLVGLSALLFFIDGPLRPASAHPGGLNAEGCHSNRKAGGCHCQDGSSSSSPAFSMVVRSSKGGNGGGAFRNCSTARAAGAAPVRAGDPGYGCHLDRDGEGVGCE